MRQNNVGRKFVRVAIVVLFGLLGVVSLSIEIADHMHTPIGYYGWNLLAGSNTIAYVTAGGPAYQAGIRAGDSINYALLPLQGRLNLALNEHVNAGDTLTVHVMHRGTWRTVTIRAAPFPPTVTAWSGLLSEVSSFVVLVVGIALVLARPSVMTWGFLLFAIMIPDFEANANSRYWVGVADSIAGGLGAAGLILFATRFPVGDPQPQIRWLDRAAIPIGALSLMLGLYVDADIAFGSRPPSNLTSVLFTVLGVVVSGLVLCALVVRFASTHGSTRQRLTPVIVTMALTILAPLALSLYESYYTEVAPLMGLELLSVIASVLFAAAVAYGILKQRVIDVSFIISRTVVYTILTICLVAVFALFDFLLGKWLERTRVALVIETGIAVAVGVWLNALHVRVGRLVDSALFRRRHCAEKRLTQDGAALAHATTSSVVDAMLVAEPADALGLASAAIFRRNGTGDFKRGTTFGWHTEEDCTGICASDVLVIRLQAECEPVELSESWRNANSLPNGFKQPIVAIPVMVRNRVEAVLLYGGHRGGEGLDPDELRSLTILARDASAAYDHIEAESLRSVIEELRGENALLRTQHQAITELTESLTRHLLKIEQSLEARA